MTTGFGQTLCGRPNRTIGSRTCDYASPPYRTFQVCVSLTLEAVPLGCIVKSLSRRLCEPKSPLNDCCPFGCTWERYTFFVTTKLVPVPTSARFSNSPAQNFLTYRQGGCDCQSEANVSVKRLSTLLLPPTCILCIPQHTCPRPSLRQVIRLL